MTKPPRCEKEDATEVYCRFLAAIGNAGNDPVCLGRACATGYLRRRIRLNPQKRYDFGDPRLQLMKK
jgi:hypothetical protein